jgi:hypothetical protein
MFEEREFGDFGKRPDLHKLWKGFARIQSKEKVKRINSALQTFKSIADRDKHADIDKFNERYRDVLKYLLLLNAERSGNVARAENQSEHSKTVFEHMWRIASSLDSGLHELAAEMSKHAKCLISYTETDFKSPPELKELLEGTFLFFDRTLIGLESTVKESQGSIRLTKGRERGAKGKAKNAKQNRERPDSTLKQALSLKDTYVARHVPERQHAALIAKALKITPQYARRLLKKSSEQ